LVYADREKAAATRNEKARLESEEQLYHALLDHAAALRVARGPGYRDLVWEDLQKAASLSGPWQDPGKIRREVQACLGDPIGLPPAEVADMVRAKPVSLPDDLRMFVQNKDNKDMSRPRVAVTPDGEQRAVFCPTSGSLWIWRKDGTNCGDCNSPLGFIH